MEFEVFVSYKYTDGKEAKERIMRAMSNGICYNGEKGYASFDEADDTLKNYMAGLIDSANVTIVIISPELIKSRWAEWEIEYSLNAHLRDDGTLKRNGIICIIENKKEWKYDFSYGLMQVNNSNWAYNNYSSASKTIKRDVLPELIVKNMQDTFNILGECAKYLDSYESNFYTDDYCIVVSENAFLKNPEKYLKEAYKRSKDFDNYLIMTKR